MGERGYLRALIRPAPAVQLLLRTSSAPAAAQQLYHNSSAAPPPTERGVQPRGSGFETRHRTVVNRLTAGQVRLTTGRLTAEPASTREPPGSRPAVDRRPCPTAARTPGQNRLTSNPRSLPFPALPFPAFPALPFPALPVLPFPAFPALPFLAFPVLPCRARSLRRRVSQNSAAREVTPIRNAALCRDASP